MADFHQPRFVPTLHALGTRRPSTVAVASRAEALGRSVTLVLPALACEVDGPAFPRILRSLECHPLLDRVILVLGSGTADQERRAEELIFRLKARVTLVKLGDPAVRAMTRRIEAAGFECPAAGKGHACWIGLSVALAGDGSDIIVLHDCDILTYDPSMVTRLVAPLVMPDTPYDFAKGFYPRVTSTLHGRVTRLLMAPLLRALQSVGVASTLPAFLADFRYPLAGEVAFSRRFAELLPVHGGWGLEIGTLAEAYRHQRAFPICQVDIADTYDHRHRPLGTTGSDEMTRMTEEILVTLVRMLRREQVPCDAQTMRSVLAHYRIEAARCIDAYAADARVNGLEYDGEAETLTTVALSAAIERCLLNGFQAELPTYPSWQQLRQHLPRACDSFGELSERTRSLPQAAHAGALVTPFRPRARVSPGREALRPGRGGPVPSAFPMSQGARIREHSGGGFPLNAAPR